MVGDLAFLLDARILAFDSKGLVDYLADGVTCLSVSVKLDRIGFVR